VLGWDDVFVCATTGRTFQQSKKTHEGKVREASTRLPL